MRAEIIRKKMQKTVLKQGVQINNLADSSLNSSNFAVIRLISSVAFAYRIESYFLHINAI